MDRRDDDDGDVFELKAIDHGSSGGGRARHSPITLMRTVELLNESVDFESNYREHLNMVSLLIFCPIITRKTVNGLTIFQFSTRK